MVCIAFVFCYEAIQVLNSYVILIMKSQNITEKMAMSNDYFCVISETESSHIQGSEAGIMTCSRSIVANTNS